MRTSHAILLLATIMAAGCKNLDIEHPQPNKEMQIGYLDGKYRTCLEDCPTPTPKEIDDSMPIEEAILERLNQKTPPEQTTEQQVAPAPMQYEVHFDFGASTPNKIGMMELFRFIEQYAPTPSATIKIIGSTDPIGTRSFNRRLAKRRALFVKEWLKAHNVTTHIVVGTQEECCLQAPYDKGDLEHAQKRKVTIIQE